MAKREDRRRDILDAARTLFSERGYHAVSLSDIAETAGLSVGLIYYVFPKKEDILVEVVKEGSVLYHNLFDQVEALENPVDRLDKVFHDYYHSCEQSTRVLMILYKDLSSIDKTSREEILTIERQIVQKITAIIEDGQQRGYFKPSVSAQLAAFDLISIGHMWALKRGWLLGRMSFADFLAEQYVLLHAMLLA